MPKSKRPSTPLPSPAPAAKAKRKPGRPEFEPTQADRDLVVVMAAMGIPEDHMVLAIRNPRGNQPIGVKTLRKYFRDEIDKGVVQANSKVAASLFKNATTATEQFPAGNPTAQIFWLKTRARWQQRPELQPPPVAPETQQEVDEQDAMRRAAFVLAAELSAREEADEAPKAKRR